MQRGRAKSWILRRSSKAQALISISAQQSFLESARHHNDYKFCSGKMEIFKKISSILIHDMLGNVIDTVETQTVPVDSLYYIINAAKEVQFAQHGRCCVSSYDKKMEALELGEPQERLKNDRLARDVIRILLSYSPINIAGNDVCVIGRAARFPHHYQSQVESTVNALIEEGLLDWKPVPVSHNWQEYAFESEVIRHPNLIWKETMDFEFIPNEELRNVLREMLSPFAAEKPQYVLQER